MKASEQHFLRLLRRTEEAAFNTTATITRGGGEGSIDEQGVYSSADGTSTYEGPCLVRPAARDLRKITFEESQKTVHIYDIRFPANTDVEVLDLITVTSSADVGLVGRSLVVRDVLFDEWSISRKVVAEELR